MKIIVFLFLSILTAFSADWPQWLGPTRNGHAGPGEKVPAKVLREAKPLWKISIGGGFASPIIIGGRVIFTDESGDREVAHCLETETGKEIWQTPYAPRFGDEWGVGPRATPFSDGERVYVQSCDGEFRCLNLATGKSVWGFNFENYGVKFLGSKAREGTSSRRGNNGSGILDGNEVIVPVGSSDGATLVCLDKLDGTLRWKSGTDESAYSSVVVADIAGARQVVFLSADALTGTDRITGEPLWRVPLVTNAKRHTMTPVVDGNRVYVNSHTFGTICFEIVHRDGGFSAVEKWRNRDMKINLATPVLVGGHLYSHGPGREYVCMDAATGKTQWIENGFGDRLSSTVEANGMLFVLTDAGEGLLIRPNGEKFDEVARGQLCGKNWNYPALGEGRLLVRDQRELSCFDTK